MDVLLYWGFAENADRLGEILYSEVKAVDLVALEASSTESKGVFIILGVYECKSMKLVV